nr:MAG TPA: NEUROSERPIN, Serine protease inhibitor, Neuronal.06A [Caudoviricetes sp.]
MAALDGIELHADHPFLNVLTSSATRTAISAMRAIISTTVRISFMRWT